MFTFTARVAALVAALLSGFHTASAQQKPSAEEIPDAVARLVAPLIESRSVVGVSIGLVDGDKSWTLHYGHADSDRLRRPDASTIYEIGSITKTFTGILLAEAVERGRMKLDDPVVKYLPDSLRSTAFGESGITLLDLVTHHSGLPRMPHNFEPGDPGNPFADYSAGRLLAFLSSWTPEVKPGIRYEYSNLGSGLLGWVLATQAGTDYPGLVRRIAAPLGMASTTAALGPELAPRMAEGHDADGERVPHWDFDALAGAGAICSSIDDMLLFLKANLGITKTSLRAPIDFAQTSRRTLPEGEGSIGLGWHIFPNGKVIWHNGATAGFHSLIVFNREKRQGVVVLSNTSTDIVEQVGADILKMLGGAKVTPVTVQMPIRLDTTQLQKYVGEYEFAPGISMTISRQRDRLYGQLTGQGPIRIYPSSETSFFLRAVDARLSFVAGSDGRFRKLVLHQNGQDQEAARKE